MTTSRIRLVEPPASDTVHAYTVGDAQITSFGSGVTIFYASAHMPVLTDERLTAESLPLPNQSVRLAVVAILNLPGVKEVLLRTHPRQVEVRKTSSVGWSDVLGTDGLVLQILEHHLGTDDEQPRRDTFQGWAIELGMLLDRSVQYPDIPVTQSYFHENLQGLTQYA